jgi:hypothetical protein
MLATTCALLIARSARADDPSLDARRECEDRIAEGKRGDAVLACSRALQTVRSSANVRALVRAYVDGPAPPTTTELTIALSIVAREHESGGAATAAAAACDIAEKIGDMAMLERCENELRALAPDDPARARAAGVLDEDCPPWRFYGGWTVIAAAALATLWHATRRRALGRAAAATSAALALFTIPAPARADVPPAPQHGWLSKWPIDDVQPEAKIPPEDERNADPLQFGYWLQDLTWKAERSSKLGDHAASAKYYRALGVAVPDRAIGYIKACEEYEANGERDKAIDMCGQALLRDGLVVKDYARFVGLVLAQPRALTGKEESALAQVIAHMKEDPAGRDVADDLECQIGARTRNVAELEECTIALIARAPDDARTISYRWALAVAKGDDREANALVDRARALGMSAPEVDRMAQTTRADARRRMLRYVLAAAAVVLLVLALGYLGRQAKGAPSVS